jgi:hypothetical protein
MTVVDVLKARIAELEREWETAKENAHKAVQEAQEISEALQAFREALKAESQRKGIAIPTDISKPKTFSDMVKSQTTTQFIRRCVKGSGPNGITPLEVKKALEQANIKAHRNYAYAVLLRLKAKGEFTERGGKYYAETVQ